MSLNEFIRNIRINEAAKLINLKSVNISEIATKFGFNEHKYFTQSFKKKYNLVTKQYVEEK